MNHSARPSLRHSMRTTALLTLLLLALPGMPGTVQGAQEAQESVPFETLLIRASSGVNRPNSAESVVEVITSRRQWKKAWKRAYWFLQTPPPLPEIDFSQRMVIVLDYRYLPDPSFTLSITDLIKHEDYLEIAVLESARRGAGCPAVPAVTVFPSQIIETEILKKKYRNDVRITAQREVVDCGSQHD